MFSLMNRLLDFEEETKNEEIKDEEHSENLSTLESLTSDDLLSDFVFSAAQPNNNFYLPSQLLSLQSNSLNFVSEPKGIQFFSVYSQCVH